MLWPDLPAGRYPGAITGQSSLSGFLLPSDIRILDGRILSSRLIFGLYCITASAVILCQLAFILNYEL